jgi:hypothetical protein
MEERPDGRFGVPSIECRVQSGRYGCSAKALPGGLGRRRYSQSDSRWITSTGGIIRELKPKYDGVLMLAEVRIDSDKIYVRSRAGPQ